MNEPIAEIDKLRQQVAIMRPELTQYLNDLRMWLTASGNEYAHRRIFELRDKLEEIDSLK